MARPAPLVSTVEGLECRQHQRHLLPLGDAQPGPNAVEELEVHGFHSKAAAQHQLVVLRPPNQQAELCQLLLRQLRGPHCQRLHAATSCSCPACPLRPATGWGNQHWQLLPCCSIDAPWMPVLLLLLLQRRGHPELGRQLGLLVLVLVLERHERLQVLLDLFHFLLLLLLLILLVPLLSLPELLLVWWGAVLSPWADVDAALGSSRCGRSFLLSLLDFTTPPSARLCVLCWKCSCASKLRAGWPRPTD